MASALRSNYDHYNMDALAKVLGALEGKAQVLRELLEARAERAQDGR